MKPAASIVWDDTILPFQLDSSDIRGRVARLESCLGEILGQHDYPASVEVLVAEAVLLTALIGQTIKLRWKLSLQIRGKGPIRLIATDYYAAQSEDEPARIRAYASYGDACDAEAPGFAQMGEGYFAILLDQGAGTTPWSGMTPLTGTSLADAAQAYFAQSEQLPTSFVLGLARPERSEDKAEWRAGGMMIQHMPKASPSVAPGDGGSGEGGLMAAEDLLAGEEAVAWNRVNTRLESLTAADLTGEETQPPALLLQLFESEQPRVFPTQALRFGCPCSAQRVMDAMSIYSDRDIAHMTTEEGLVTADCQFCGAHYEFDPADLGFEAARRGREG